MNTKEPIRRAVSRMLGAQIPKDGWRPTIETLNRQGRIDARLTLEIIILLCERVEDYERTQDEGDIQS